MQTAAIWSTGRVDRFDSPQQATEVGALPLMTGPVDMIHRILLGALESVIVPPATDEVLVLPLPAEPVAAYLHVQLWLADCRKMYEGSGVIFHVNEAANPSVKNAAARAISSAIH